MNTLDVLGRRFIIAKRLIFISCIFFLSSCGFHLQTQKPLITPLQSIYIQSSDPYGPLARQLKNVFQQAGITLQKNPAQASSILVILKDINMEELLSVSNTQQTRQYNLIVQVDFQITDAQGNILLPQQTLIENHTTTIQASQILAGSNEINILTQQMRRTIAVAILNRISSKEVANSIINHYQPKPNKT